MALSTKLCSFRYSTKLCFLLFAFLFTSCKKFIDVPPPSTQLVTASVFNNNATATSAVTYIYTQMFNNQESENMAGKNGQLADELTTHDISINDASYLFYTNALTSRDAIEFWQNAYSYIFQANAVISGLQQYAGTSPAVKQQLIGEAYFIRAFWHFYLTNCYGAVPVVLTTDYTITDRLSRTPRPQVLQQVVNDLTTAEGLLSSNYVDGSDTIVTPDRVRPNKAVAEALLARAYLYLGDYSGNSQTDDYQQAEKYASMVINNSAYSLCTNLSGPNSVFLANSSEAIWQLDTPLPSNYDTLDGEYFVLLAAPSNGGNGSNTISPELLNAFESGDQRNTNWVGKITVNGTTYYFPYKYKQYTYTGTEYTMVLRLAEQYLIRAEAKAELGDTTAINDLNAIRNRAGLANYSGASDKVSLLTAILHERQVELFTEWGQRWIDLNRAAQNNPTGVNISNIMGSPGNVCKTKGGSWSSYKQLYPIQLNELKADVNLTQNPGY